MMFTILIFIFVCGSALLVISYLPSITVKGLFDYIAFDNDYQSFSNKHIMLLRLTGILLYVAGGLLCKFRTKIMEYMSGIRLNDFVINPKNIIDLIFVFIRDLRDVLNKEDKLHKYSFFLIFMMAITIRIYYMSSPWLGDEVRIFEKRVFHAVGSKGLISLLSGYDELGDHKGYSFLSYISYNFLGDGKNIWLARLPSLLAGILFVPVTYLVTRLLYDKYSALLASGVVAASLYHIYYSYRARGYAVMCLLFFLILALGTYLRKNNELAGWHLFAILSAFGFYVLPLMLWPYGIVITWLILSIIFKDTCCDRGYLLKNLFISITLTVFLIFLLYSPVIFIGNGLQSLFIPASMHTDRSPLGDFVNHTLFHIDRAWTFNWNNAPDFIVWLFVIGFFISLIFHKKISTYRINIAIVAVIFIILALLVQRPIAEARSWLFLLLLYSIVASSGVAYLFKKFAAVFGSCKSTIFSVLTIVLSIVLIGNKLLSDPPWYVSKENIINETGEFIDVEFVINTVSSHIIYDEQFELYGITKRRLSSKILTVFMSPEKNSFFMKTLQKSGGIMRNLIRNMLVSDMNLYLSKDSKMCHNLYILTNEDGTSLGILLEEKGLSITDYSESQLIHQDRYLNLHKMRRITDCRE